MKLNQRSRVTPAIQFEHILAGPASCSSVLLFCSSKQAVKMELYLLYCSRVLLSLASTISVTLASRTLATCRDVSFTVSGSAMNRNLTALNLSNSTQLLAAITNKAFETPVEISGCQTLAGTYCEPLMCNKNNDKLQILFHGITSGRTYWSALGGLDVAEYQPEKYSWVDAAHENGYPTLALDRLGAGQSSHPDPVNVVQGAYE